MRTALVCASLLLPTLPLAGCAAQRIDSEEERTVVLSESRIAVDTFIDADPGIQTWVNESYGYAVFPAVGKGAVGVGGAYGQGVVYRQGEPIGTTALSQGSIGFQLGGQKYREIIFFEDREALEAFTTGRFEFAANASAVAVEAGASAAADFYNGMAIFTMTTGGLMFEASIGGQKFTYRRLDD